MKVTSAKQCFDMGCDKCPGCNTSGSNGEFNSDCYFYEDLKQSKPGSMQSRDQLDRLNGVYPATKPIINLDVLRYL